jgi:hypothetical protein
MKICARVAVTLFTALSSSALAQSVPEKIDTISVETSGAVPGFSKAQLNDYLAKHMQEPGIASWRFIAGGKTDAPNRVVWKFKALNLVWKGGAHRGFPSQNHAISYLRAEVKLYLNGEYQMTMDMHPSVLSGDEDQSLSEMAKRVTKILFDGNQPEKP